MNTKEILELQLEMKKMEKKTDEELWEIKKWLDKAVSTLEKKLPRESFVWNEEYVIIAKELGQKFFLSDKISQILTERGKGKYRRTKEEAIEYFEHTWNKANKAIDRSHLGSKIGSDSSISSAQYHMLTD